MSNLKGTKTEKNLLKSFAGESQARNRYTFFASQAAKDGYKQIESIFLETARNEKEHAELFFKFLPGGTLEITDSFPAGKIGNTEENLKAAAEGENEEHTNFYPEFEKTAREEGFSEIATAFEEIAEVEEEHEKRFLALLNNLQEGKVFEREEEQEWKCGNCGYVHTGKKAPEKCPACLHDQKYFRIKETNY